MTEEQESKKIIYGMGDRVRKCRNAQKMQQQELAEAVDITPTFLSEIEHDKKSVSLATFVSLMENLHTSADYLLSGLSKDATIAENLVERVKLLNDENIEKIAEIVEVFLLMEEKKKGKS